MFYFECWLSYSFGIYVEVVLLVMWFVLVGCGSVGGI